MRVFSFSLLILLLCQGTVFCIFPRNIFETAVNITTGTIEKIPDLIPSPSDIFENSKQLIAGYPFEVVADAINQICSHALSAAAILPKITPDLEDISFLHMTPEKNYSYPLLDADNMWKSPAFDRNKTTIIMVTGWTTDLNDTNEAILALSDAFFCRGNINFVAVDTASFVDTLYTWSALNTEDIGEHIGAGLVELTKYMPPQQIHLIGHSLGAHIVGAAGRAFNQKTGKLVGRITGLDPAKPCFNEGEALSGLQRGDADFIDVVHSNPGVLGKRDPMGDVDFYPGGLSPLPKGCFSITCAHARSWEYFAETIYPGNENNFVGVRCNSLSNVKSNKCPGDPVRMGYSVSKELKGNYFLEVRSKSPFGMNAPKKGRSITCSSGTKAQ